MAHILKTTLRLEGEIKAGLGLRRWEQKIGDLLRGVEGLMQPVPAHNNIYHIHIGWLDLSSQARRGTLQAFWRSRQPPPAGFLQD